MRNILDSAAVARALAAMLTALAMAVAPPCSASARVGEDVPDYALSPVPSAPAAQKSAAVSKFKYMFGAPARWPGMMRWRYNHANAPAQFSKPNPIHGSTPLEC